MKELYENFDVNKKSLYFKDDGSVTEEKLKRRRNSRIKDYSFGYCSMESVLGGNTVSIVGNVGRHDFFIYFIFFIVLDCFLTLKNYFLSPQIFWVLLEMIIWKLN
jgi:hypothetical protein